ncbi:MAG: flagellar biosynthesis protein FlhB [Lachnospiraceae bacterium]|jgi:flagellar biosynthetic protein FlhB|nr:flagellar biosynthesis protein FlhB [Lachnospiraceae bacterium]
MDIKYAYNLQLFAKDGPGGEKTEPATAKKLKDARDEGKVAKSKELDSAFQLLALFIVIKLLIGYLGNNLMEGFFGVYNRIPDIVNDSIGGFSNKQAMMLTSYGLRHIFWTVFPVFIVGVGITLVVSIIQVKWKVTFKPMKPNFGKLNPLQGAKKILSKDSLFELVKSIAKIGLICIIAYKNISNYQDELFILYEIELKQAIGLVGEIIIDTGLKISIFYIILGIIDYLYSKHKFNEDMKMTKQEVKDEFKNTEGNPEIKGRQRQVMRQASQRRMMANVPQADVVITNPTHLSVALKYDTEIASAPIVVAKGEDYVALKIREIAKENHVEIVENKPLARMLYANVEIDEQVPPELYQAVAEVLALVYQKREAS